MTDDSNPLGWLPDALVELNRQGLLRRRRRVTPLPDGWCEVDGRRLRNFASNDYLNLAGDARLAAAAREALENAGAGARASALVTGRTEWHERLEQKLAEFERQPAAILFPSGYAANVGTLAALAGEGDAILCDRLNHASLVDGCRLSGAQLRIYRHDNLGRLERELQKAATARRRFLVTDSVFSMDGDLAPLPALCDLAERHDAALVVDEAHATGLLGPHGRGVAEWQGVEDRVTVRIGTLSKALGSLGGFVAGPQPLIDWLWNRARTQIFSTALPPSACAAAFAAVEIIQTEPWRRERVLQQRRRLQTHLAKDHIATIPGGEAPIVPVILSDPKRATTAAEQLERQGFLVAAIRPPTVPQRTSRLRITLSAAHTENDVDALAEALRAAVTA